MARPTLPCWRYDTFRTCCSMSLMAEGELFSRPLISRTVKPNSLYLKFSRCCGGVQCHATVIGRMPPEPAKVNEPFWQGNAEIATSTDLPGNSVPLDGLNIVVLLISLLALQLILAWESEVSL